MCVFVKFKIDKKKILSLREDELSVSCQGCTIKLTRTEFRILRELLMAVDHVCARGELLGKVWGQKVFVEPRTIDRHVVQLRRKLKQLGQRELSLETVWGTGYRLRLSDSNQN